MGVRVTQEVVEPLETRTSTPRTSQLVIEPIEQRESSSRVTQLVSEILILNSPSALITQYATEVLEYHQPSVLITQYATEIIERRTPVPRITQLVIEVLRSSRLPADVAITVDQTVTVTPAIDAQSGTVYVSVEHTIHARQSFEVPTTAPYLFTGVLGTDISQLGQFLLGTDIKQSTTAVTVEHSIHVGQDITADIDADPFRITMGHTIGVVSAVLTTNNRNQTLNHTVTVGQTLAGRYDPTKLVASNINVAQSITTRNTVTRITVESAVHAVDVITTRGPVRLTVTSAITVDPLVIIRGREVLITVEHSLTATPLIVFRNTVVRITVNDSVGAHDGSDEDNTNNRQALIQTVHVESDQYGRNDRLSVDQLVTVTDTISVRSNKPRITINQPVTVTELITAMNPNITVNHVLALGHVISARSDNNHQFIGDVITIAERIVPAKSPLELTVNDTINIPQALLDHWPAVPHNDNMRSKFENQILVSDAISGGSDNRQITVTDIVLVTSSARTSWQFASVSHSVGLSDKISAGNDNRKITVNQVVNVTSTPLARRTPVQITVNDTVIVTTTRTARGPDVPVTVNHTIFVNPKITVRPVQVQRVYHEIKVEDLARTKDNSQIMNHTIVVGQNTRSTPINIFMNQTVNVSLRSQDVYMIMRDVIHVESKHWKQQDIALSDTLDIQENLTRQMVRTRVLTDEPILVETFQRHMIWNQDLIDILIIPETTIQKSFSFWPYPIDVPVFHGGLMSNLVVLEAGNDAITLPAAMLGDTQNNVDSILVQRTMNAKTMTIIKTSDRKKLVLKFRISLRKSYELRKFVMTNQSEMIRLTDWNGAIWMGRFMSNPFTHTHAGRSVSEQEYVTFDIEFEGAKIAG